MQLDKLGWDTNWQHAWDTTIAQQATPPRLACDLSVLRSSASLEPQLVPARVAREDRAGYVVYTGGRAVRATVRGALRAQDRLAETLPAVGDWVALRLADRGALLGGAADGTAQAIAAVDAAARGVIHSVLPRRGCVCRTAAGGGVRTQVIAANVDRLLICTGLDRDFSLRRVERYLTLATAGGVDPLVVLTKADASLRVAQQVEQMRTVAGDAPVVALSAATGAGVAALQEYLRPGQTFALVGSSGVGKSTLINALLGRTAMAIGAVRESDGRGRHTTTHRQLLLCPGGSVLIDTPGMRELQLPADDDALRGSFADLHALAGACRFRDCAHQSEPGCAVLAAVAAGTLDEQRLESWRKQAREIEYLQRREDPAAAAAERARWKVLHKAARKHIREKRG